MKPIFSKEVLLNPMVLGAAALAVIIALGSAYYYVSGTRVPQTNLAASATTTASTITANGVVEPAQNPNLAFASGGRVTSLRVSVGEEVSQGELLASLDTSVLAAQRAQAQANVAAAQAKLDSMKAGARDVDIAAKQTAVSQAQVALNNLYASAPSSIEQAYDASFSGLSADTDSLFNQPNSINPSLVFSTSNSQLASNASAARVTAQTELSTWQKETQTLSGASQSALDAEITQSLAHLSVLRQYADALLQALNNALPSGSITTDTIAAAQVAVGGYRDSINAQITALQTLQQEIASAKLGVTSAQDALNQTLAGSSAQDIEAQQAAVDAAQASVANFNAQIANAEIIAPFSGTVSSVQIKVGDIVTPNTPAVTLNPQSALQVTAYVSESDAGRIKTGEMADVTLDAYGDSRHFPATVASVDRSPTMQKGVPAYRVVLEFPASDPSISSGMTANVSINPAQ